MIEKQSEVHECLQLWPTATTSECQTLTYAVSAYRLWRERSECRMALPHRCRKVTLSNEESEVDSVNIWCQNLEARCWRR